MRQIEIDGKYFDIPSELSEWKYSEFLPYTEFAMEFKRLRTEGDPKMLEVGIKAVHELLGENILDDQDIDLGSKFQVVSELITLMDTVEISYAPPVFKQTGYKFSHNGKTFIIEAVNYAGIFEPKLSYGRYIEYLERRRKIESGEVQDRFTFDLETIAIFGYKVQEDGSLYALKSNVDEGAKFFEDIDVFNIKNITFFLSGLIWDYGTPQSLHFISTPQKEAIRIVDHPRKT